MNTRYLKKKEKIISTRCQAFNKIFALSEFFTGFLFGNNLFSIKFAL
jgi:hypothetical protein